jgi:predicted amidohydrolase YtcJ
MTTFTNAHFISCEPENKIFSVLIEDKGTIVHCGDDVPEQCKSAPRVDLRGKTAVPAFADTHIHFASHAMFRQTVDVRGAADFAALGHMLTQYEQRSPKARITLAFGCCAHTVQERRLPNKADLDRCTNRPTLIVKYDGHAGVANSALTALLPEHVTSDPGFDAATGWMYQNAFYEGVNFVTSKISPLSLLNGLASAAEDMAAKGIALIHTVDGVGFPRDMDLDLMRFAARGLPQDVRIFFQTMDIDKVRKRKLPRIGGCFRLALDGCFGSEDAALHMPYANNPANKGVLNYTQEEVTAFCIQANRAGLQIAMHAIGDAAVTQALNAYAAALQDQPNPGARHILIHACLMKPADTDRAAKLGILIAAQPAFLDWEQEPQEYLDHILGQSRAYELTPLKTWLEKGIVVSAGSDAPCTLPDPIRSIYCCCNHPDPSQSVSALDALRIHTANAAYTSFDEGRRGTLTEGKRCDFVLLSENPLEIPAPRLGELKIEQVYFAGKEHKPQRPGALALVGRALVGKQGQGADQ